MKKKYNSYGTKDLNDQRFNRKIVIGNIDIGTISALRKKETGKSKERQRII